ncbi:MAG: glycoside hydrolase family 28 protein, partial [Tidjanibacter sp.]|nr:glycoside hydrolase family 28 protein [Tidjanibacter sp.]
MKRLLLWVVALMATLTIQAQDYSSYYQNLPVEMPTPVLAEIPELTVLLTNFGAVGDGLTLNTDAFNKAIASLSKQGGGHLVVPAGIWLTGPIALKDNIDLHLEKNAIIMATPDRALHLKGEKTTTLISASKRKNISITGEGTIDGNGAMWRPVKRGKVSDTEWKEFLSMGGTVTDDGSLWYPYDLKHFDNLASSPKEQEKQRTHLIRFTDCQRVYVSGVTLQNAPKFHLIPTRCQEVIIDGVTVKCPWNAQNGDAIDLSSCRNALVVNCIVDAGDDGICMKAGAGESGVKYGPCENILIENNTVYHAHGGFVIGSEFSGGMRNIVVRNNRFSGTDTGLRFKSGVGRGGVCENIYISDIVMTDIKGEAIVFECGYVNRPAGENVEEQKAAADAPFAP